MRKRFVKFRVFRALPRFESCRSKQTSALPPSPQPPPPDPRSSLRRHVSFTFTLLGRSSSSSSPRFFPEDSRTRSSSSSLFRWRGKKHPKWHIIETDNHHNVNDHSTPPRRKIYSSADDEENDLVLFPHLKNSRPRRRISFRKKIRISTSSDSGLFSHEDDYSDEETGNHTDSSTPRQSNASKININSQSVSRSCRVWEDNAGKDKKHQKKKTRDFAAAPARLSVFMRKVAGKGVEGKVRESFAVVKRSSDPYKDFKRSMAEMVVEKQMFEVPEMEELLSCFLSLNSVNHHEAIVKAFADIWEALFSISPDDRSFA